MPRETRWWVYGKTPKGETVILGGYLSREKSEEIGNDAFDGLYETIELNTVDKAKASSIIKEKMFEQSHDLRLSLRKVSHKMPVRTISESGDNGVHP